MRILYQLTSPMDRTLGTGEIARRRGVLQAAAAGGTEVLCQPVGEGPPAIEGAADAAVVVPEMLALVPRWEAEGYDAAIIGCFSDPGLDALRERTAIPVIGPGAASLHLAAQLGSAISILSPSGRAPGKVAARLRGLGLADLFASVRGVGASVMDLASQKPGAFERIVEAGRACREEDGAEVLVLGCMSMAFLPGVAQRLQAAIGCPVVNPVLAALKTAEMVVALGTGHRVPAVLPVAAQ
ncbi:aspartate/glutamate racemase family protein [Enterovirga rhinocerotis]|uniref:Allantoin racemase n=1 Tax=Enterovirga rhinocerotis TaxID=1339210 RepID=A0A4R7BVC9_9HYPH|nr:aspartate/glutamate racemase family protein [Enterovirga rhinocerotis]TDR89784.1 allantoin racemase [Enterovirga rhinocerotis]